MRFGVLGPLAMWDTDGSPIAVPSADVRALLVALLVHDGAVVPAERLIDDLWPGSLPADPTNALQVRVSRLRRALEAAQPGGRALVEYRSPGYRLRVPAESVDTGRFQALLRRARAAGDPWTRKEALSEALRLWRGPALAGFADDPFARPVAERLTQQRLAALEELAEVRLELGEQDALVAELAELVHRHPDRERLRAAQLLALYRAGRQGDALAGYDEYRRRLAERQGLDPGPELVTLQRALLARDPALDTPPARSRTNLPTPVTELIGRDDAIADVGSALAGGRLVTLTGPGGVGKTRLGVAAGARVAGSFPDGVWLVELAGVRAGDAVAEAVMAVLGIRENAMLGPVEAVSPPPDHIERLTGFLRDKRVLLLLDNCEHIAGSVAQLAEVLLRAAPGLRVLTTGREPLGMPGEVLLPVPPLEVPPPGAALDQVLASGAVRLFRARATAADAGFALDTSNAGAVVELVRRLDGLPLALELAAAKVRALGVHELVARLDDRFALLADGNRGAPPRQRTLHAVLDWSWQLLTDAERVVLRRMSVLDGGAVAAVEAVCADGPVDDRGVAAVLARLVDRSMVTVDPHRRYRLLRTVAAYARARLTDAGELEAVRVRHSRYSLELARVHTPDLFGPEQRACLDRLDAETGNFHCALETAVDHGDAEVALGLVDALAWYLLLRGRVRQATRWARRALAVPGPASQALRARVGCWAAGIDILLGTGQDAAVAHAALAGFEDTDDPRGLAMAQWFLGYVLLQVGHLETSEELTARASTGFRALGDSWGVAVTGSVRANQALARGDLHTAAEAVATALDLFRTLGDRSGELLTVYPRAALAELRGDDREAERLHRDGLRLAEEFGMWAEAADRLSGLGRTAMLRGQHDRARDLYERARRLAAEHGFEPGEVYAVTGLGQCARRVGDFAEADRHLGAAAAWYRGTGRAPGYAAVLVELGLLAEQRGDAAAAADHHEGALTAARRLGDRRTEAAALTGMAGARLLADRPEQAARLLRAAHDLRIAAGTTPAPAERDDLARIATATRQALGGADFDVAFQAVFEDTTAVTPPRDGSTLEHVDRTAP